MMCTQLDWTKQVGLAFTADQAAVLASVQRLRAQAVQYGNLKSSEQQQVVTQTDNGKQVIVIQPANPQVVYVPQYNPQTVYVQSPGPSTGDVVAASIISFGLGVAVGAMFSNNNYYYPRWGYGGVYYGGRPWVPRGYVYRPVYGPGWRPPAYYRPPANYPYHRPVHYNNNYWNNYRGGNNTVNINNTNNINVNRSGGNNGYNKPANGNNNNNNRPNNGNNGGYNKPGNGNNNNRPGGNNNAGNNGGYNKPGNGNNNNRPGGNNGGTPGYNNPGNGGNAGNNRPGNGTAAHNPSGTRPGICQTGCWWWPATAPGRRGKPGASRRQSGASATSAAAIWTRATVQAGAASPESPGAGICSRRLRQICPGGQSTWRCQQCREEEMRNEQLFSRCILAMTVLAGSVAAAPVASAQAAPGQSTFASPSAAAAALVAACRSGDEDQLLKILGPSGKDLIASGDPVADKKSQQGFVKSYTTKHSFSRGSAGICDPGGRHE